MWDSLRETTAKLVAEGIDDAFVRMAFTSKTAGARATRDSVLIRMKGAADFFAEKDAVGKLFPQPGAARWKERRLRRLEDGRVVDIQWKSPYAGLHESHQATLERCPRNRMCHARWFRHKDPRPTIICIHGWGAGYLPIEEKNFSADYLYEQGLDVILFVMPFHGRRSSPTRQTPMFPTIDPVRTNEGFAQAVMDLRSLILALKRLGAPSVGLAGMSLGGFTSALMATVERQIDFAVPLIAFGSIADLLWLHIEGSSLDSVIQKRGIDHGVLERSLAATTPVLRESVIAHERLFIIAGERDKVAPLLHSNRLRDHFTGAKLGTFPGGHVLQVGRIQAYRAMLSWLRDSEILPPLPPHKLRKMNRKRRKLLA